MVKGTPMVKGDMLRGLSQLLNKSDVSAEQFYSLFDLNPTIESEKEQLIPFEIFIEMFDRVAQLISIKHPSLQLAKIQMKSGTVPYFDLILNAPNIDVAVQIAFRFHNAFSEVSYWYWEVEKDYAVVKRRSFVPVESNDREFCLYAISVVYLLLKGVIGESSQFKRILLIQSEGDDKAELERFFDCQISFNQDFDGFIVDAHDCYKPNKNFNPARYKELFKVLSNHKVIFPENQKFSTSVKSLILQKLGTGTCTLADIASAMEIHPRALQKKLAKENIVFKKLVNDIRLNNAKRLLLYKEISLTQISLILGFSEASAFSRSFHLYEKCSPRKWRQDYIFKSKLT
ncbi:MAG: AraC family transcriptional regulator [Alteromonadales bacterium]|nr:AraC family transcriptional regulator [Alteromonadales bacterium]